MSKSEEAPSMSSATASSNPVQPDGFFTRSLGDADPAIAAGVAPELQRQQDPIELTARATTVSPAVLEAQGSNFPNKYAETPEERHGGKEGVPSWTHRGPGDT